MTDWRMAKSLEVLRGQINALSPSRDKSSDGGIGNAEHSARESDHNPDADGVVKARDFTHDPEHGVDSEKLANKLLASRDSRIKYVISNRKIASGDAGPSPWVWRPYGGANPHDHHFHISVKADKDHYDSELPWNIGAAPVVTPAKPAAPRAVRAYCLYGLGGRMWSAGMEDVVAASLRKIPGVHVDPTRGFTQWREIVEDIKRHPGDRFAVLGHSMGAAAATYVTDFVHVDLVVCYDCAGQSPSPIGKNCERLLDFQDVGFDFNPNFRPRAVAGYESRIERIVTKDGHVAQDDDPDLMGRVVEAVKKLGKA